MRKALAFPVVAVFVFALFVILQETGAEEPEYEAPELQLKFNLKEDGETLSQQNKMPDEPEAHSTGRAEYTQYPFFRSDREPTQVGTWTSSPAEFDVSINIDTTDIWWEVKGDDYFNVRYQVKPFMIWIWISTFLLAFGGSLSLFRRLNEK